MIQLTKKQRFTLSISAGILLILSFPFTGSIPFFAFIGLAPLLLIEDSIFSNKYKSSKLFIYSYITFFLYNLGTTWWIWNASSGGAILAFFLNSLIMAAVFQLFHITKKRVGIREGYTAFILFWIGFEYIHYEWELSWPWLNFGNVFASSPKLIQWYSVSGVLGGSFWILLVNLVVFFLVKHLYFQKKSFASQRNLLLFLATILIFPIVFSLIQYYSYDQIGKNTEIIVTQPNVDPYNEKFTGSIENQLDRICDLADSLITPKTEFVLAPETALPFNFYEDEVERIIHYHYLVERKAKWNNSSLLIGASTSKFFKDKHSRASRKIEGGPGYEEYYNSSMLIDQHDKPRFLHKSKLVLGVEKVPFSNIFPALEKLSIDNGGASGTLGIEDYAQVFHTKGMKIAPIVCYESLYGSFVAEQCHKGAELLFVITNDGWWGNTPGYKQHRAFSQLRAIENRKSVARSANTGISCFINQRGDILSETSWWQETSLRGTLKRNQEKTFYATNGDLIGRTFGAGALVLLVVTLGKIFRSYMYKSRQA
jgi:apolipoprotein N-acyltransferase